MLLAISQSAWGGGIMFYEVGSADVGLASAGYSARAQDPSTVLTNPAGMTRLSGTQVLAAAQLLYGEATFSPDSGTTPSLGSNDGGNPIGLAPGGSFFITHNLSPELSIGFGVAGNFGLAESYDDNWVGRYYVQESTLMGISALPSVAYKLNDDLSIGATLNIMTAFMDTTVAVNRPANPDASLNLKDDVVSYGINLGVLYNLNASTRIGLTYTSEVDLDFNNEVTYTGVIQPSHTLDMDITVPQTLNLSFFHQLDEQWALLGSTGWQDWSEFGLVDIEGRDGAIARAIDANLKDTWNVALGAQYQISAPWLLNFGMAYDSGFQDSNDASPMFPVNAGYRFATGLQNKSSEDFEWGVSLGYLYGEEFEVHKDAALDNLGRGDLSGSYQPHVFVISANAIWKF